MNPSVPPSQIAEDVAAFGAPPPEVLAEAAKKREAAEKARKQESKVLKPKQLEMADKLADQMNEEKQAAEKAKLIQQLQDYIKLVKEYHPERLEFLKVPKTITPKMTLEELRIAIHDVQTELGKKGGLEMVKVLWVEGFKLFEKANESGWLGLNVAGLGQAAQLSVLPRRMQDGEIVPGPAVPTLAEFCVKHHTWFSTDVDVRLMMMVVEMVSNVHRLNTKGVNPEQAQARVVPAATKAAMNNL